LGIHFTELEEVGMKSQVDIKYATMKSFPLLVTLVSCVDKNGNPNIITITYITGVNEEPPMIGIAMRPEKYSNHMIKETGDFTVNIPTNELLAKIDYCGTYSGQNVDKFKRTGLTSQKSARIKSSIIEECPINLECKLVQTVKLPSHDLFIGEVVALHIDKKFLKKCTDSDEIPDFSKLNFIFTTFLDYRKIGKKIGTAFEENKFITKTS